MSVDFFYQESVDDFFSSLFNGDVCGSLFISDTTPRGAKCPHMRMGPAPIDRYLHLLLNVFFPTRIELAEAER